MLAGNRMDGSWAKLPEVAALDLRRPSIEEDIEAFSFLCPFVGKSSPQSRKQAALPRRLGLIYPVTSQVSACRPEEQVCHSVNVLCALDKERDGGHFLNLLVLMDQAPVQFVSRGFSPVHLGYTLPLPLPGPVISFSTLQCLNSAPRYFVELCRKPDHSRFCLGPTFPTVWTLE